jgi:SpoVK/Ycf46/Vps4 family AAA+-type ATPase
MSGDDGTTREFIQGLWNIRDQFKGNKRTIVLLDQDVQVPVELQKDVIPLVEKLPSKDSLREIILRQYKNTNIKVEEDKLDRAIESIVGLSAFQSEQVAAMSMTASGLNVDEMWDMKRALIEDTPGLSINRESFKYDDIGGLDSAKEFLKLYFGGKRRPTCIIFIDEIEKAMAGQNDSTGISQDQLGQMLQFMQNSNSTGALFAGHSGSGKSALAKATGGEFDVPVLELDFNAMKGGIVGTSETNLRNAIKVIDSVAGGGMNALFIATSNNLSMIPPELKSRFKLGTFMFDLPTAEEQKPIWAIHKKKNGISSRAKLPPHDNWTGREIENCCSLADAFETDLVKAAKYIVPVSVSDEKKVERLRHQAHGRWMDSTKGGIYRMPNNAASHQNGTDRTVSLGDDE